MNYSTSQSPQQPSPLGTAKIKRRTLVGPWKNVNEFCKVYDWLFAETSSIGTQRQALDQIQIWNLRRSNLCPAAVLATKVIVEVQLKDFDSNGAQPDLQTIYANAFTRFFNFMSSIMQTHNMRTMYDTARQLGLQSFVVDLRHICAHGQLLPPLEVLRNTAEYCLSWLHDYYWCEQRAAMTDVDATRIRRKDKTDFDENVSELFGIYDSALECYFKGAHNMKTSKRHLHGKRFARLKAFYEQHTLSSLRPVFDVIVKDLAALVKREIAIKDLQEIYIEALLKMKYFFTVAANQPKTEQLESLIDVTQSLFRMLAVYGFIEDVFHSLLDIAENPIADASRRAGASFWATQIVAGFLAFRKCKQMYKLELDGNPNFKDVDFSSLNFASLSKKVRKFLIYGGIDIKRTLIFGDSFRRPWVWVFERNFIETHLEAVSEYTAPVLKSLLPLIEPSLNADATKTLATLIDSLFERKTDEDLKMNDSKVYTAADLLTHLQTNSNMNVDLNQNDVTSAKRARFGLWQIAEDDELNDWTTCPLGRLPWE